MIRSKSVHENEILWCGHSWHSNTSSTYDTREAIWVVRIPLAIWLLVRFVFSGLTLNSIQQPQMGAFSESPLVPKNHLFQYEKLNMQFSAAE
jgi:hypothetical protein